KRFGTGRLVLQAAREADAMKALGWAGEGRDPLAETVREAIIAAAAAPDAVLDVVRSLGLVVLTIDDAAYPSRLLAIDMPPQVLFVRGDPSALAPAHAVAVVGTRRPTDYGRRIAGRIAAAISDAGATVVSGLAVGIDGSAHAAAVAAGRPTVAVL